MKMLLYKAWVETRVRFFASLVAVTIVCTFNMQQHAWLVKWWAQELQDPKGYHLAWMVLGIHNYGWYLWHYLYDNYLQQVWALFALLFAFGGLIREKTAGSVLFSLGLPVSRRRWLFTRLAMAFIESVALSLFAIIVVMIGSSVIHQSYSLIQILLHTDTDGRSGRLSDCIRESVLLAVPGRLSRPSYHFGPSRRALPDPSDIHAASPIFRQNQLARLL